MIAVIRVRGVANVSPEIKRTLELLRLHKPNHLVLLPEERKSMVQKAKDYVTFGEISEDVLTKMLEKRGRLEGDKKISFDYLKEKKFRGFEEAGKAVLEGKETLKALGVKPVFRLGPPRKGHSRKGIKKSFVDGGVLGYRGEKINKLIMSMI